MKRRPRARSTPARGSSCCSCSISGRSGHSRQKRPALHAGFERLLVGGRVARRQHPSAATVTAPGHALLGTGEPPARLRDHRERVVAPRSAASVLTAVEARGRQRHRRSGCASRASATRSRPRTTARRRSRSASRRARRCCRSVMPDSRSGTTPRTGAARLAHGSPVPRRGSARTPRRIRSMPSSTTRAVDAARPGPVAKLAGVPDDAAGRGRREGLRRRRSRTIRRRRSSPADAVFAMPLGNELVLDLAIAAIDGEQLGADRTPDLLVDQPVGARLVGHGWGHESWEQWDSELRLDQQLARVSRRARPQGRRRPLGDDRDQRSRREPAARDDRRRPHDTDEHRGRPRTARRSRCSATAQWIDDAHFRTSTSRPRCSRSPKSELDSATSDVAERAARVSRDRQVGRVAERRRPLRDAHRRRRARCA